MKDQRFLARCGSAAALLAALVLSACASKSPSSVSDRGAGQAAITPSKDFYLVKKGDTLHSIAVDHGDPGWLLDKWRLGPLRLLNFFALLYLALWLGPYLAKALGSLKPLILIGRNTLPLFCLHVCFSALAIGVIELYALPDGWCYSILILQLALILGASLLLGKFSNNPPSDQVPAPSVRG